MSIYTYKCKLVKVIDGDTIDVMVDLGFRSYRQERIRLSGIDTPEKETVTYEAGIAAMNRLTELLPSVFIMETIKDSREKYGRFLGIPYTEDGKNICEILIDEGHAVKYNP